MRQPDLAKLCVALSVVSLSQGRRTRFNHPEMLMSRASGGFYQLQLSIAISLENPNPRLSVRLA